MRLIESGPEAKALTLLGLPDPSLKAGDVEAGYAELMGEISLS